MTESTFENLDNMYTSPSDSTSSTPVRTLTKTQKIVIIVVVIVVVVAVGLTVGLVLYFKHKNKKEIGKFQVTDSNTNASSTVFFSGDTLNIKFVPGPEEERLTPLHWYVTYDGGDNYTLFFDSSANGNVASLKLSDHLFTNEMMFRLTFTTGETVDSQKFDVQPYFAQIGGLGFTAGNEIRQHKPTKIIVYVDETINFSSDASGWELTVSSDKTTWTSGGPIDSFDKATGTITWTPNISLTQIYWKLTTLDLKSKYGYPEELSCTSLYPFTITSPIPPNPTVSILYLESASDGVHKLIFAPGEQVNIILISKIIIASLDNINLAYSTDNGATYIDFDAGTETRINNYAVEIAWTIPEVWNNQIRVKGQVSTDPAIISDDKYTFQPSFKWNFPFDRTDIVICFGNNLMSNHYNYTAFTNILGKSMISHWTLGIQIPGEDPVFAPETQSSVKLSETDTSFGLKWFFRWGNLGSNAGGQKISAYFLIKIENANRTFSAIYQTSTVITFDATTVWDVTPGTIKGWNFTGTQVYPNYTATIFPPNQLVVNVGYVPSTPPLFYWLEQYDGSFYIAFVPSTKSIFYVNQWQAGQFQGLFVDVSHRDNKANFFISQVASNFATHFTNYEIKEPALKAYIWQAPNPDSIQPEKYVCVKMPLSPEVITRYFVTAFLSDGICSLPDLKNQSALIFTGQTPVQ